VPDAKLLPTRQFASLSALVVVLYVSARLSKVSPGSKTIKDHPAGGIQVAVTSVGVTLGGKRVGDGVKVGSPGRCVTKMICVGKLVKVGVWVMFIEIEGLTSEVATA
jgi:hypothetical protein